MSDEIRRRGRPAKSKEPVERASEEELTIARDDFEWYAENCLMIRSKRGGPLVPFKLNYTQRYILAEIKRLRAAGIPPRLLVLKSRQVGVSTLAEAIFFHECHLWPNQLALVVAHKDTATKGLFQMSKRFADHLPERFRQERKYDNVRELHFENDSRMQVETVGEARSFAAQKFHGSEIGFWQNAEEMLQAVMQTLPATTESLAILESTANGAGNALYELWTAAVKARDDANLSEWEKGWTPIFIPWFRHAEYHMVPWFRPDQTTQEERYLAHTYKLNMRQLAWRRWCIRTNCRNDPKVFAVEYPSNWKEAFLLSGRPVFDQEALGYYLSMVPPETPADTLPPLQEIAFKKDSDREVEIWPVEDGRLRIFTEPIPRHTYVAGVDPSEGDPKSDPTPIEIIDEMTLDHVAEWHGRQPPDVLARTAMALGYYYNEAKIAHEANNHGILFQSTIVNAGYPNIHYRETSAESVAGRVTDKPGWLNTNTTKHAAFDTLRIWVRERKGKTRSPIIVGEMLTLIYKRREGELQTKIEAQPGAFRDAITALAIALWCHRGVETDPLVALPEAELESAALRLRMLQERNPELAREEAVALFGFSCDDLLRLDDARAKRAASRDQFGTEVMR